MSAVAKIISVAPIGFDGHIVEIESDMKNGLPNIQIVGLGSKAIDEAKERVRSAITNSLLDFPAKKLVINLAPAELPKDGSHYDVPIALAILTSAGQLRQSDVANAVFAGELALDGSLRPIKGAISITETSRDAGYATIYLPQENVAQAKLIDGIEIVGVPDLKSLFLHLKREQTIVPSDSTTQVERPTNHAQETSILDDIRGQDQAKRALIIAAAGHHNILFTGSPGAGKTMLAKTLVSLLPPLTKEEQVAVTKLHSLAGETKDVITVRPFRSPHHTSSRIALIGGGNKPKPGDISLAHLGVLFLDEMPEYPRATLESLRQPLEDKIVSISRVNGHVQYPADFMLVATMNPCPCGYFGDDRHECSCTATQILAYQQRLSGPLLDRIDIVVPVGRVKNEELLEHITMTDTQQQDALNRIGIAYNAQANRYESSLIHNASLSSKAVKSKLALSAPVRQLLAQATDRLNVSARSYFKIIKVAQTIADLDGSDSITPAHVAEALQYRITK